MRDLLPQPSISNNQTVEVEHSTEPIHNVAIDSNDGAGEVMASPLDEHENLVWELNGLICQPGCVKVENTKEKHKNDKKIPLIIIN